MESPKNLKTAAVGLAIMAVSLLTAMFFLREKVDITRSRAVQALHTVKIPKNINWVPARLATEEAGKAKKPIFCFFTAENNKPCRELENRVLSDSKVSEMLNQNFVPVVVVYLDSLPDSSQEKRVCKHYDITLFPTLLITDPDGKKIAERKGASAGANMSEFLSSAMRLKPQAQAQAKKK